MAERPCGNPPLRQTTRIGTPLCYHQSDDKPGATRRGTPLRQTALKASHPYGRPTLVPPPKRKIIPPLYHHHSEGSTWLYAQGERKNQPLKRTHHETPSSPEHLHPYIPTSASLINKLNHPHHHLTSTLTHGLPQHNSLESPCVGFHVTRHPNHAPIPSSTGQHGRRLTA